jgi:hypothetical protein
MSPWPSPHWMDDPERAQVFARIARRRRPARRLLGLLAAAVQIDSGELIDRVINEALAWPDTTKLQCFHKASLLFALTGLLAGTCYRELALKLAPMIPLAPGMAQVLILTTEQESYCWRVTSGYALAHGRTPRHFPVDSLIQPYRRGEVTIDDGHVMRLLSRRRGAPPPILLLAHPLGMVHLDGTPYLILDGNHRVVCAWRQRRYWIPGLILSPQEGEAVLLHHSQWPPYPHPRKLALDRPDYLV